MTRKPKIEDTVYLVTQTKKQEVPIVKIGKKYFYTDDFVFEIDSYVDGSWYTTHSSNSAQAYISEDVFLKQREKNQIIKDLNPDKLHNMSYAKIKALSNLLLNMPNDAQSEDWEQVNCSYL